MSRSDLPAPIASRPSATPRVSTLTSVQLWGSDHNCGYGVPIARSHLASPSKFVKATRPSRKALLDQSAAVEHEQAAPARDRAPRSVRHCMQSDERSAKTMVEFMCALAIRPHRRACPARYPGARSQSRPAPCAGRGSSRMVVLASSRQMSHGQSRASTQGSSARRRDWRWEHRRHVRRPELSAESYSWVLGLHDFGMGGS
jgi:hypothetical protein